MNQVEALVAQITEAAKEYYEGSPIMSDPQFDQLVEELRELDPEHPVLSATGWGYVPSHRERVAHSHPVEGLSKIQVKTGDNPFKYLDQSVEYAITPKYDGISAVAYYGVDGKLERVLTRGDGKTGIDITKNVHKLIPDKVEYVREVRGEIVMPLSVFNEHYKDSGNPCTTASGLVMSGDIGDRWEHIDFVAYSVRAASCWFNSYLEMITHLFIEGFTTTGGRVLNKESAEDAYRLYDTSMAGHESPYPVDGAVVRPLRLLVTGEGPIFYKEDGVAIKYPTKTYEVVVTGIANQVSALGRVTPVIEFESVKTDRGTISRMSGFNYAQITRDDIGVGSILTMTLANEIIPHWVNTIKSTGAEVPEEVDGMPTRMEGSQLVVDKCNKRDIIFRVLALHRPKGVGGTTIKETIDRLGIDCVSDIKPKIAEALKSTNHPLLTEWYRSILTNSVTIPQLFCASVTRNAGWAAGMALNHLDSEAILGMLIHSQEDLIKWPTSAALAGVRENRANLILLFSHFGVTTHSDGEESTGRVKVCFTGKLSKPRNEIAKDYQDYIVQVDIKAADYLVTNDPNSTSGKAKTARALGIKIITESELVEMINEA